mgnify:FL=1
MKSKEDDIDVSPLNLPEEMKTVSYKTLVEGIIRPRLNEMFQTIASEIKKSGLAGLTPSGLVLCGGGAMTVSIVESAKRMLGMPVRVGTPSGITGLIDDITTPAFATSVGLLKYAHSLQDSEVSTSSGFSSSLPSFDKLPIKGVLGRITAAIKSLLP